MPRLLGTMASNIQLIYERIDHCTYTKTQQACFRIDCCGFLACVTVARSTSEVAARNCIFTFFSLFRSVQI